MEKQRKNKWISSFISFIIIVMALVVGYRIYEKYNFNEYTKAEYQSGVSKFLRDDKVKYANTNSYKIENVDYNDATFYKKIEVTPNTPYKVTCMVKTKDVKAKNENTDTGANISIEGTTEKSDNIVGTTDWTKLEFFFNAKERTQVNIQFRLGSYMDNAIGTAWFSDFTIESGVEDTTNEWNFLCLLMNHTNVNLDINGVNEKIDLKLTVTDMEDMKQCMRRFQTSMQELSQNKMKIQYDMVEVNTPITSMSYDKENGYYVSPSDIEDILRPYIEQGKYDHIFIAFRTGDINKQAKEIITDWIGLRFHGL